MQIASKHDLLGTKQIAQQFILSLSLSHETLKMILLGRMDGPRAGQ
jgi:hypothetical protein